jgi:pSer/pThr/pTyr-binding forkhead associated (FHA) protein
MESSGLSSYEHQPEPAAPGELVLLNGRQSGARRALGMPVTYVGRAQGCDIRLNVDGVGPFHCVLAVGPNEVTVRDLGSERGTFVNGQPVSAAQLRDGDLLDVGPFRFRVMLPVTSPQAVAGLSVQAAAVAAQQAGLDEEEVRLLERRLTLDQQEAQLAAHLDEQRQELVEAAQRQQADRLSLTRARADLERQWEDRKSELEFTRTVLERDRGDMRAMIQREQCEVRAELEREREKVRAELEHDREVSRARCAAEEQRLAQSAATIGYARAEVQQQQAELEIRQVRFNTERELDSRLLQEGWRCLEQDQQRWRERRSREGLAVRVRRLLLVDGERKLAVARSALFREKQAWEAQQHGLESELYGLNTRVVHQRQRLQDPQVLVVQPPQPDTVAQVAGSGKTADLERVASLLRDQRIELIEQWERLARVESAWHDRRDELASELEAVAHRLAQQEETLTSRERDVESSESRLQQAQDQLEQLRRETSTAHIRFQVQRQAWESEREHIQAEARRVGEVARYQLDAFGELRRKWNGRRRRETEALRVERHSLEQLRQELARARQELGRQTQQLEDERRALIEQEMTACEQRGDAGAEQLRHRWLTQNATVLRTLKQQRAALKKDLHTLIEVRRELCDQADQLTAAQVDFQERETGLEHREAVLAANEAHLEQQTKNGEGRRQHTERRLALLQEESEHLARALIPDGGSAPQSLDRAA